MKADKRILLAKELLKNMGARSRYLRSMDKTIASFAFKGLEELIMDEADKSVDALLDSVATIYTSVLSEQDLQELLDFFGSKAGKRYVEADLEVGVELTVVATKWSKDVLQRAKERYQSVYLKRKAEEGINPKDYIPPLNIRR